jgi:hypothetical protein
VSEKLIGGQVCHPLVSSNDKGFSNQSLVTLGRSLCQSLRTKLVGMLLYVNTYCEVDNLLSRQAIQSLSHASSHKCYPGMKNRVTNFRSGATTIVWTLIHLVCCFDFKVSDETTLYKPQIMRFMKRNQQESYDSIAEHTNAQASLRASWRYYGEI